jgi:hypothetical protein
MASPRPSDEGAKLWIAAHGEVLQIGMRPDRRQGCHRFALERHDQRLATSGTRVSLEGRSRVGHLNRLHPRSTSSPPIQTRSRIFTPTARTVNEVQVSPESLDAYLSLDLGPLDTPDAAVFRDVLLAQRLRRKALVRYKSLSSGKTTNRRLHPYHVFNLRGNWYVAAWDEARREVRDFAIHRIRRIAITTDSYEVPRGFEFRKYMADAFGIEKGGRAVEVAIRFGPRQARWIRERRWHRSARIQEELDGALTLRLRVADTSELHRWVLQFGAEAEVLSPPSLRQTIAETLRTAGAAYRDRPRGRKRDR